MQASSGYSIPYDGSALDLVILAHVVEHLEYPKTLLYEAGRVGTTYLLKFLSRIITD
jgi:hypothetical protein